MSRGLSQQQRQILGVATHVNRLTNGGTPAVKRGAPVERYSVPTVDYNGPKDLQWPLPAHLLYGLPFVCSETRIEKSNGIRQPGGRYFLFTQASKRAKASVVRAMTSLVRTGYLCVAPDSSVFRWGYVLTDAGLERGLQEEYAFPEALIFRAGLIVFPTYPPIEFYHIVDWLSTGRLSLQSVLDLVQSLPPGTTEHVRSSEVYKRIKEHEKVPPMVP